MFMKKLDVNYWFLLQENLLILVLIFNKNFTYNTGRWQAKTEKCGIKKERGKYLQL